jgi:hypothetical protein
MSEKAMLGWLKFASGMLKIEFKSGRRYPCRG